ncbi:hypothetical protein IN666_11955 [Bacteroides fragilis]|uniref:hypothetical protein n=1 Tax=Bacteroides TaxID=816 RepID=UPI00187AEA29|nr:hypothetical protein [Bacteroides fragilis]MBE7400202.1 hypothetical protein [Bacteroides fragilis]
MEEHVTIQRKREEQDLYTQLQEKALAKVQELAGELWTDYNEHDPGVTVLDVLNYALLETDYRLGFDLQDYLTAEGQCFSPGEHALFPPSEVFPVNPVTVTDYRKLFIAGIEGLSDVQVVVHHESGIYDFVLDVDPEVHVERKHEIMKEVYRLFHAHRNLCENVGEVSFLTYEPLQLYAEIEIDETEDASYMMARLYFEVREFFGGGVRFCRVDELLDKGMTIDEILEGPVQRRMVIDESSMCTGRIVYDILDLYQRIKAMPGIHRVTSLYFMEDGRMLKEFIHRKSPLQAYSVSPFSGAEEGVVLKKNGKCATVQPEVVQRVIASMRAATYGTQNQTMYKAILDDSPEGTYRNIFTHCSVRQDLPEIYGAVEQGSFKEYLALFDGQFISVLNELESLPFWMRPDETDLNDKKEAWMDILDRLYGEDSNPTFLRKYETDEERRKRRINFLSCLPEWGRDRNRAFNLQDSSPENRSGLEKYIDCLLHLERYEAEIFVVEHPLLELHLKKGEAGSSFRISVIWTAGERWIRDEEFKHNCEQLVLSRIPAHIQACVYWLEKERGADFRTDFRLWKYALSTSRDWKIEILTDKLKKWLTNDFN